MLKSSFLPWLIRKATISNWISSCSQHCFLSSIKHEFSNMHKKETKATVEIWIMQLRYMLNLCTFLQCQITILFQDATMNKIWSVTFTMNIRFSFKPYEVTFKLQIHGNSPFLREKVFCKYFLFLLDWINLAAVKRQS